MFTRVILYILIAMHQTAGCVHIWVTNIDIYLRVYAFAIFSSTQIKIGFVNTEPALNPLQPINVRRKMKRDGLNVAEIIICCNPLKESPQTEH